MSTPTFQTGRNDSSVCTKLALYSLGVGGREARWSELGGGGEGGSRGGWETGKVLLQARATAVHPLYQQCVGSDEATFC